MSRCRAPSLPTLQAADQFKLFTGKDAPVDLMRMVVLDSLAK